LHLIQKHLYWLIYIEEIKMGEMADYDIEQGENMWFDHLAEHPDFPDKCPYCKEEYEKEQEK